MMMTQDHCPVSLGQLEMEGPLLLLSWGRQGVMVAEADPPNPSPQEGTGESLKHRHGNAHSCSLVQLLGTRNLGWELRASWKIWRSWETPWSARWNLRAPASALREEDQVLSRERQGRIPGSAASLLSVSATSQDARRLWWTPRLQATPSGHAQDSTASGPCYRHHTPPPQPDRLRFLSYPLVTQNWK